MTDEEFREAVRDALDSLPPEIASKLTNVAVIVEDRHPSGRLMAVAHISGAKLVLVRIGDDGGLHFARAYDIDVGQRTMWWMGMVEH